MPRILPRQILGRFWISASHQHVTSCFPDSLGLQVFGITELPQEVVRPGFVDTEQLPALAVGDRSVPPHIG